MKDEKQLIKELLNLDWFEKCGIKERIEGVNIEFVKDKKTLDKKICGLNWENKVLDKSGDMSEYLGNLDEKYLEESNEKVEYYRENYIPRIERVLQNKAKQAGFAENIITDIRFNLLIILEANYFSDLYRDAFWNQMLEIYKSGHIPCGYKKGVFLIY